MKKLIILSISSFFCLNAAFSQTQFSKDYEAVRTELVTWDAVRGEWLANSFEAMVNKQAIPERTFPEDLTPNEMYNLVPKDSKKRIETIVTNNQTVASETSQRNAWNQVAIMTRTTSCKPVSARTFGDPHLTSFDGASFSFQTVGEFIMTKSASGHMEVQTRQRAQADDFSLNTAVAMNVAGDRVCVYANEKPDNSRDKVLRLNGNPIDVVDKTYYLPHGGTIVKTNKQDYIVNWPTGERVVLDIRNSGQFDFINLVVEIVPCLNQEFLGVLGNANGSVNDDFTSRNGRSPKSSFITYVSTSNSNMDQIAKQAEAEHLAYLTKDFASEWRVTSDNSLFDYGFNENTFTYTDLSFPRVHHSINDLSQNQRTTAQKSCEDAGIRGADLQGCIYDRGFLNIPANPRPVIVDRSEGVILTKIDAPRKPIISNPNDVLNGSGSSSGSKPNTTEKPVEKTQPITNAKGSDAKPTTPGSDNSNHTTPNIEEKNNMKVIDLFKTSPSEKSSSTPTGIKNTTIPSSTKSPSTPAPKPPTPSAPKPTPTIKKGKL